MHDATVATIWSSPWICRSDRLSVSSSTSASRGGRAVPPPSFSKNRWRFATASALLNGDWVTPPMMSSPTGLFKIDRGNAAWRIPAAHDDRTTPPEFGILERRAQ